ncbi:MAG: zinc ribbon domain-containing protein [Candidatus Heimdallarchaeota archaeon]
MSGNYKNSKVLKFVIKLKEGQEHILNKLTARRTFAVREYLKLIDKEEKLIAPKSINAIAQLEQLTIITRNRATVPFDFKELTKLNTVDLQACGRTAITIWRSYQTWHVKWEKYRDSVSSYISTKMLTDITFDSKGELLESSLSIDDLVNDFSEKRIWRKIQKKKPAKPCTRTKYKPKKIPVFVKLNSNLLAYQKENQKYPYKYEDDKLTIKISTLRIGKSMELELIFSDYHLDELDKNKLTGGRLYKNTMKNRWEFHAKITKEIQIITEQKQKAIIGIDLGQINDATVVVLRENKPLKQDQIFFLKESDIRKRKFNIIQRKNILQRKRDSENKTERRNAIKELKILSGKEFSLTKEGCHRITKKIASITQNLIEQGYEVHVGIGKLKGLRNKARRGNGKGKHYRRRIHHFSYSLLTNNITYKCKALGVRKIRQIAEAWTSKTCHLCDSTNTKRPKSSHFICEDCGLQYNADINGAINIAQRYWTQFACRNCDSLNTNGNSKRELFCSDCKSIFDLTKKQSSERFKMIFLPHIRKSEGESKSYKTSAKPQGIDDSPSCNESAGMKVQIKVEEARQRKRDLSKTNFKS